MRRKTRRQAARRGYHDGHQTILESGHDMFGAFAEHGQPEPTNEQLREAWQLLGGDIMQQWLQESPCTRPWAWWHFQAREDRPDRKHQRRRLEQLGVLTAAEIERANQLEALRHSPITEGN